jgi:hypothetical protein
MALGKRLAPTLCEKVPILRKFGELEINNDSGRC